MAKRTSTKSVKVAKKAAAKRVATKATRPRQTVPSQALTPTLSHGEREQRASPRMPRRRPSAWDASLRRWQRRHIWTEDASSVACLIVEEMRHENRRALYPAC